MNWQTASSLVKGGRLRLLWQASRLFNPFYRLSFVASAASSGLLALLAKGPQPLEHLARELAPQAAAVPALVAWLGLGVRLGELELGPAGYALSGFLSVKLAEVGNEDVAALVEEVATFHHRLILETPRRTRANEGWALEDHDGELIARSSRILEPFLFQLIERTVPRSGALRLLEVGCGSGTYMRHAARHNPMLTGVGVEMQGAVAEAASRELVREGLHDRLTVEVGDIRQRRSERSFDVVTLHNAIYYFRSDERPAVFSKLASFLRPGGRLIVTSSCQDGSPGMQLLNLWTSSVRSFGPLPTEGELVREVEQAGFRRIELRRLIPGERYVGVLATHE